MSELKRAYDPDNVFRAGHNIDPMSSGHEDGLLYMRPILDAHHKEDR